jgi:hypothetical protein
MPGIIDQGARFRRTFTLTVGALVVLVAAFTGLTYVQGPKLSSAQVDTTGVVSKPNQELRLFTNQPVRPLTAKQVTITPAVPFTVTSTGAVIAIQFPEPLGFATGYRVALAGVASAADGQTARLGYDFTTASPALYYLHRGGAAGGSAGGADGSAVGGAAGGADEIIRTSIAQPALQVVYSAARIQDFEVFDHSLAVVTEDAHGASSLVFINGTGLVEDITLPGEGTIDQLHGDRDSGVLGFVYTDGAPASQRQFSNILFTVDPAGTAVAQVVSAPDGTPLAVTAWSYVPASSDIIAQLPDHRVLVLDPANPKSARTLGTFTTMGALSTDGAWLEAADVNGPVRVNVATGAVTRLVAFALHGSGASQAPTQTQTQAPTTDGEGGGGEGETVVTPTGWLTAVPLAGGSVPNALVFDNGRGAREIFQSADPNGAIRSITVSPNNQYAAIETDPNVATSTPDGYPVNGRPTSITTNFVDIASGALVKSVAGFDATW